MSVKIIAELNPFCSERVELAAEAKPIAEIITQLNTGFPLSQARVSRNGEIVKDFSEKARDGDTLWIKFLPHGSGEGMKVGGWALVALGIAAMFIPVIGWGVGVALIGTGLGMALGGQVLMNLNIPSLKDKDQEKPENDPSIRGSRNQARPHGRIPVLFGRHRIYPDLAANPHTEIIKGQQYYTQLFCGGYKDYVIDPNSLKLGETALVDFSQTKDISQILAGADPLLDMEIIQDGQPSRLYPHCVHEDMINAPLKNKIESGNSSSNSSELVDILKDKLSNMFYISGEIIRETPDNTDIIKVDIFLYNGIGKYNNEGEIKTTSVEVKASYKRADDDSDFALLGFFNNGSNIISGKELKTKRFQITAQVPRGKYKIKIERVTSDSTDSKIIDEVHIGSIRSIKTTRPIRDERQNDLTIIALRVMATEKFNGVVDSLNFIATSKLPVYSGQDSGALYWLSSAETRNPAAILLHALRGKPAQQQVDHGDIDWQSFENFYLWCEEHGYICDAYLSESVTIAELLRMIGSTARADILRIDSKISVVQDIERVSPVQLFTPKNTKGYSVTMFSADIPDAISLRFIDEAAGYAQSELNVYHTPDGNPGTKTPETIQKADLWGITNSVQARRIGMYNYACLKNRPFVHTIEVDIEYLMCNKGDRIQYAGDLALTGAVQGRIVETLWEISGNQCTAVRLDEPPLTEPGKQYSIRIRRSDGTIILKDVAITHEPDEVYFTEPLDGIDAPREGDIYAFGIRGQEVIDLIITDIQPQADFSAVLTCVEYSPAIFDVDDPDFLLPEFENKITPVSGAIDSGVVGTARWRLFVTYHDSEAEPPRPSGDGQSEGWHYAHTTPSLWQSSKTAETVDSGEWGLPVRIKGERSKTDTIPVYLTLSPQTKILDCDVDGNILTGLLPFSSQAALYRWNYCIPVITGIDRFPGTGGDIFDPMLGDFVPAPRIIFSLGNAPQGISIDSEGMITVAANARLDDEHSITVNAEYDGDVYSTVFFVQVRKRVGEARYLGTIETLPQGNEVTIIKGPAIGLVRALQGNYVLAIASGTVGAHTWQAGRVYQWTGIAWEYREPENHSDLYIRCFKDGLEVPSLTQDAGWFGALFARLLVAQQAFIEELQTQVITLREGGLIQSEGFTGADGGTPGFGLWARDGTIEAYKAKFRDLTIVGDSFFEGDILSGPLELNRRNPSSIINTIRWEAGTSAQALYAFTKTITPTTPVDGIYGSTGFNYISAGPEYDERRYVCRLYDKDRTIITSFLLTSANYPYNYAPLLYAMQIGFYNPSGRTVKLNNLPFNEPNMSGAIWRDAQGYLRIKI